MRTRTVLLSLLGVVLAAAALDGAAAFVTTRTTAAGPLDLSAVSKIRVEGEAGRLFISAAADGPYEARLEGERRGWGAVWRSGWFPVSCPEGGMRIDGDTLVVDLGSTHFYSWSDCTMTLTARLKPEAAVAIDQRASQTDLRGDFSAVDVRSDAGDVRFRGHAAELSLSGAALRARVVFDKVMQNETVALAGNMLDAGLHFLVPTPVSYLVEATASFVDSKLPNTPGAKPAIRVRGDMVRVRIE